jgi:branched-chain amino acid transport system permease protein
MDWSLLFTQLLNGLQMGLLLFLLSAGLTLIFGIMDFINLSHGSFYMIGAYFCGTIAAWSGSFFMGVVGGLIGVFVLGILVEQVIARKLYRRDHLDHLLITFGLILIFDTLVHMIWGAGGMAIPLPKVLSGQIEIGTLALPAYRLLIIVSGLLVAGFLYLLVGKTRLGMLIRAGASNRVMVEALGVDINRLFRYVFALGAALAGLAGLLIAPITEASIGMGNDIIILAFVVCIVGGIGSIKGAFYAAMFLGLMDTLSRSYLNTLLKQAMPVDYAETAAPAISAMLVYILMAAVLAIRPQGLFPPAGAK